MGLCELAKKKKNIILYMCAREKRNYIFRYTEKKGNISILKESKIQ